MPIMIGGGGEKVTLRIVAQHADIWNGFGDPGEDGAQVLGARRVVPARRPRPGGDRALGGRHPRPTSLPHLDAYLEVGITHLIMGISGPEWDLSLLPKLVEWRDRHS